MVNLRVYKINQEPLQTLVFNKSHKSSADLIRQVKQKLARQYWNFKTIEVNELSNDEVVVVFEAKDETNEKTLFDFIFLRENKLLDDIRKELK